MEVIVGKLAGFCPGVENTVKKTKEILLENGQVYCLGELVHNKQVISSLENIGMITVNELDEIPDGSIVIFRAHGEPEYKYELGMTWEDWVLSSYNTDGFTLDGDLIVKDSKLLRYNTLTRIYSYYYDEVVEKADEIVMNVNYKMLDSDVSPYRAVPELRTPYLKLWDRSIPRVEFYDKMSYVHLE